MEPSQFSYHPFGEVKRSIGKFPFFYFSPSPIPRSLFLDPRTIVELSDADAALGQLVGVGKLMQNPQLLIRPYMTREALSSSRIEGTQATLSEFLEVQASESIERSPDIQEVENYILAMNQGIVRLKTLPLSLRLISEIHETLMTGVRGQEKLPGSFRSSPNFIGSPTTNLNDAVFVPPIPEVMHPALDDLEKFMNQDSMLPLLVKCALVHYQFETIHPFLDGNGRLGRLLIVFYLIEKERLPAPLLYLSPYFEQRRGEYYDRLQMVRERGEIQEWLQFFLAAVKFQARDAAQRVGRLTELREEYRSLLIPTRSRAAEVLDLIFENPIITVSRVRSELGLSQPGALGILRKLESYGILNQIFTNLNRRRAVWIAQDVFYVISGDSI